MAERRHTDLAHWEAFICHSSKDAATAVAIAEALKGRGLRVWIDKWAIQPGDHIGRKIEEGLAGSRVLVVLMSPHTFGSDWVEFENWTFRFRDPTNRGRRFVPMLIADCNIPDSIKPFAYINYGENKAAAIDALAKACSVASKPAAPPGDEGRWGSCLEFSPDCVRPLYVAEDRYLQLLLSKFTIARRAGSVAGGFEIQVSFDDHTRAIWGQEGKRHLRKLMPEGRRRELQKSLDAFLLGGETDQTPRQETFEFAADDFVFRYASGGTLPIISFGGGPLSGDYYCLFYREVHPIGWNIANGGTDSRAELLAPRLAIERELREELIVADFLNDERYVFPGDSSEWVDHPAHLVARRLWTTLFPHKNLAKLRPRGVDVKPVKGPDSARLEIGDGACVRDEGFFLNVNAEDFGIEFDQVAKIELPGHVILFDGEIEDSHLVNAPIGLFEVARFNSQVRRFKSQARGHDKGEQFRPDFFFHGAALRRGEDIDGVLEKDFMPYVAQFMPASEVEQFRRRIEEGRQYGLCPVTESLVRRYLRTRGAAPAV